MIGTGGKVIREIVEKTGAKINIEDDGTVKVASADGESIKAAINWIKSIASDPEVGHIYDGTVVKVMDFGAFVNFFGAKDGLVHISQLAARRVQKTSDVVKEGDKVKVKLLGFDDRGKMRLSMKVVDQETGEDLEGQAKGRRRSAARSSGGGGITRAAQGTGRERRPQGRAAVAPPLSINQYIKSKVQHVMPITSYRDPAQWSSLAIARRKARLVSPLVQGIQTRTALRSLVRALLLQLTKPFAFESLPGSFEVQISASRTSPPARVLPHSRVSL